MRDEQGETDRFERLCGGRNRAGRLFRVYQDSYPYQDAFKRVGKADVFRSKARREGFSVEEIEALLRLQ